MCRNILLLLIILACSVCTAQNPVMQYTAMRETYAHLGENDRQAMSPVRKSIELGRKNRNFRHLVYAYEDAIYFSPDRQVKLKYSDSAVQAAYRTKDEALISKALLGRGIVWYFNYRQYGRALHNYLEADTHAQKSGDKYLIYKVKYHIGAVKSFLGYHREALENFRACNQFFAAELKSAQHPTFIYNNTKGYLNSLHQMCISHRQLGELDKVDSLLERTAPYRDQPDFAQESGYFLKEQGILSFHRGDFRASLRALLPAAAIIKSKKDEGLLAVTYYYIGTAYLNQQQRGRGIPYMEKVDSLFRRNGVMFPEVRAAYEFLLKDAETTGKPDKTARHTAQLLKADSIFQVDLPYLSSRIYREYDTKTLRSEKEELQKARAADNGFIIFSLALSGALLVFLLSAYIRQRIIVQNYQKLQQRLQQQAAAALTVTEQPDPGRRMEYSPEIVQKILIKLEKFEKEAGFTSPKITLLSLAAKLGTNKNHLSYVINEYRNMHFSTYLTTLRINYITHLMNTDPKYLKFHNESLAEECGIRSRQHFSRMFHEINGIKPSDFIRQKKKELNIN